MGFKCKRLINRIFTAPAMHGIVSPNNNKYGGLLWQKQITERHRNRNGSTGSHTMKPVAEADRRGKPTVSRII